MSGGERFMAAVACISTAVFIADAPGALPDWFRAISAICWIGTAAYFAFRRDRA